MSRKTASTSPFGSLSGARSTSHRASRPKPCCGPNDHCPNWAASKRNYLVITGCVVKWTIVQESLEHWIDNLRKTKGIPPRIGFFPSNTANLLELETEDERLVFSWKYHECEPHPPFQFVLWPINVPLGTPSCCVCPLENVLSFQLIIFRQENLISTVPLKCVRGQHVSWRVI